MVAHNDKFITDTVEAGRAVATAEPGGTEPRDNKDSLRMLPPIVSVMDYVRAHTEPLLRSSVHRLRKYCIHCNG